MGYNPATGDDVHKVELSNIKYIAIFDIVEPACQLLDYIVYPSSTHLHITQCPVSGGGDGSQVDFKSAFSSDFWTRCPLMLGSSIDQIDFHRPHQKAFLGISCTFEGESHPRLIYDTWHWDVNATDLFVYITRLNLSRVRHMRYRSDDGGQPCAEQWVHLLCRMPALVSIHFNEMDFGGWSCCGLIIALDSSVGVPDHPESTFLPNLKHITIEYSNLSLEVLDVQVQCGWGDPDELDLRGRGEGLDERLVEQGFPPCVDFKDYYAAEELKDSRTMFDMLYGFVIDRHNRGRILEELNLTDCYFPADAYDNDVQKTMRVSVGTLKTETTPDFQENWKKMIECYTKFSWRFPIPSI
jgi:hypothetical protein